MQSSSFTILILIIELSLISLTNQGKLGIDHSQPITIDQFKCLLQNNHTYAYIRAWRSFSAFDTHAPKTLMNALQGGLKVENVGVYMFPCFNIVDPIKSPENQVNSMIEQLKNAYAASSYSSIWIDMETNPSAGCSWSTNYVDNCNFLTKIVQTAKKYNKIVGIYASYYMWNQIMGGIERCAKFIDLPLWYAHYDGVLNFSDYKAFGGWVKPSIKQYKGSSVLCGINGLDLNYKE